MARNSGMILAERVQEFTMLIGWRPRRAPTMTLEHPPAGDVGVRVVRSLAESARLRSCRRMGTMGLPAQVRGRRAASTGARQLWRAASRRGSTSGCGALLGCEVGPREDGKITDHGVALSRHSARARGRACLAVEHVVSGALGRLQCCGDREGNRVYELRFWYPRRGAHPHGGSSAMSGPGIASHRALTHRLEEALIVGRCARVVGRLRLALAQQTPLSTKVLVLAGQADGQQMSSVFEIGRPARHSRPQVCILPFLRPPS